jgi:gliding motility-associated-like protein
MNMKKVYTLIMAILSFNAFSQTTTLYSDDFEGSSSFQFQYFPVSSANSWKIESCAGNGITNTGSKALYTSKGGINPGCGVNGTEQYANAPALPSSTERIIALMSIDGRCTNSHSIAFDYKLDLTGANNLVEVVYSLNGSFWYVQDTIDNSTNWKTLTVALNAATDNNNFFVGFRYIYSDATESGSPLAVDNFSVNGLTSTAYIAQDSLQLCGQTTVAINAGIFAGTGTWSILSSASPSTSLTQTNSNNTALNNLGFGTTVLKWEVVSPNCGTTSDTIYIINSAAPSNANVQDTVYACAVNQLNITTSVPIAGTGMWSTASGATFADANSPVTTVSNLPEGWSQIIWTISSPGCTSEADTMTIFKTGGQQILTNDTTMCIEGFEKFVFTKTPTDSLQTVNWVFATGNALMNEITADSIELTGMVAGTTTLIYEVEHNLCPKETDTLKIVLTPCEDFEPVFPTVITPNGDGKNDLFVIQNLENIYPNCQVTIFNRYGKVVFESTGYQTPWNGTFKGEKLPMGAYFFKLELNDGSNKVYSGSISLIH